jgi:hypothetical protein
LTWVYAHLLVNEIERGFVDKAHVQALLADTEYCIITTIQRVAIGNNVSILALENNLILTRHKLVAIAEEPLI